MRDIAGGFYLNAKRVSEELAKKNGLTGKTRSKMGETLVDQ